MSERIDFGPHPSIDVDVLAEGDSYDVLRHVADGGVDAIYIDPPFGTGTAKQGRGHRYADRADDPVAFVEWLAPQLAEMRRCLAVHGSLFVHLDYRTVHYVKVALDGVFGRERFVNEIVWCYSVGGKSRRGFARKHDTILWYARGADYAFFPDAIRVPRRGGSHMRVTDDGTGQLIQEKTDRKTGRVYRYVVAAGKIPEDWWTDIETLNHSAKERTGYPSQKPERLLERVIGAVTMPGQRVLDCFAGSGTTAVVAQRMGRHFVTSDREAAAVAVCTARLTAQGRALAQQGTPPSSIQIVRTPQDLLPPDGQRTILAPKAP